MGLPIHLVRVVDFDPVRATVEAGAAAARAYAETQAELVDACELYLAAQVQRLRDRDAVATSELRNGAPASELLAATRAGDVTVLTTRDRGAVERWMLGSVAEALVRQGAGPVVLVRGGADRPRAQVDAGSWATGNAL